MSDRIQYRRDTKERWAEVNPVLMEGEIGLEIDTKNIKMGDGVHAWNELEYCVGVENITSELGNSENLATSQKLVTDKLSDLIYSDSYFANPKAKAKATTLQIAQAIKELYISDFNEEGWLLCTIGRNQKTGHDTPWTVQFYPQDLNEARAIKFNSNENPEGDSGISLLKSGNNYLVVDWNKIPDGFYKTSLTENDYLIKNDIIYSLDANPAIKAELLYSALSDLIYSDSYFANPKAKAKATTLQIAHEKAMLEVGKRLKKEGLI